MSTLVQPISVHNNQVGEALPSAETNMTTPKHSVESKKIKPKSNSYIEEKPTWSENLKSYFSQYCMSTGIHGIRYLGESGRFVIEKILWAVILIVMCYLCIDLILKAFHKWKSSPVIVTFATTETPIWKIPFPAVTICPEIKTDPDIFNYSDIFLKKVSNLYVTPEENEVFESLAIVCPGISTLPELVAKVMENSSYTVKGSAIRTIFDVSF
ncbi:hypothetical protein ILUMI_17806 [Ignelater luminosus]|uniref:Uncharacterized protein n=1 Tax=Ignelater luminosus TaxID=2038154 RepID=A0A8K0CQC9_IGNLU|nr:hypothetical protein ILUMI_17806 [Ignelater luminosus]